MEYDTASRSLVPIQPKSEAAESWDPVMCAQCPICNRWWSPFEESIAAIYIPEYQLYIAFPYLKLFCKYNEKNQIFFRTRFCSAISYQNFRVVERGSSNFE